MAAKDPVVSAWFGVESQRGIRVAFREWSGLGSDNDVVPYKASGPEVADSMLHAPARMKWQDITLRRGITDDMDMWKWRGLVEEGKITDARKNGSIVMFNQKGDEMARWDFTNARPSKITGPTANAGSNEVAVEEMVITHEGY